MSETARPASIERDLLLATLDLPTEERQAYLDQACEGRDELKTRMRQLLENADQAGSFMGAPAIDLGATRAMDAIDVGCHIDRYRIMEQIGEGGMGIVFVAEQTEPVRRKVALKIIKPGMDSKSVIARFEAERQALALMDHPNIARVFDAGTTGEKLPYFVMELVKGSPIQQFCDSRDLPYKERLELFIKVCAAVEHAHQKGIIHRDLKPSNILVSLQDDEPQPKIIDFGIAKATTQSLTANTVYTGHAQIVGTPQYMSPEQVDMNNLDIDTRSDVYSLGIVLYEMLTGSTPFNKEALKQANFDEFRRIVREQEPERPSSRVSTLAASLDSTLKRRTSADSRKVSDSLRGELDWIVLKALEKDRRRRYQSARELSDDVKRYLNDEPVLACPPSIGYRCSKLIRRHRGAAITTTLVMAAILVGAGVSIWQAIRARNFAIRADARSQMARTAVDEMYSQVAEKWLTDEGELSDVQRDFLQKALNHYQEFCKEEPSNPQLRAERLSALSRVAVMRTRLGHHADAEQAFIQLIADRQADVIANRSDQSTLIPLVEAQAWFARLLHSIGREEEANNTADLAFHNFQEIEKVDQLSDSNTRELSTGLDKLTSVLIDCGNPKDAETVATAYVEILRTLVGSNPDSQDDLLALAVGLTTQGSQRMWWGGRNKEAEESLREAEKLFAALAPERGRNRMYRLNRSRCLHNMAVICTWEGRKEESLSLLRQALLITESLSHDYPKEKSVRTNLVYVLQNISNHLVLESDENLDVNMRIMEHVEALVETSSVDADILALESQSALSMFSIRLARGEEREADAVLDLIIDRFEERKLANTVNMESLRFWDFVSIILCSRAGRHIEQRNHVSAAKNLSLIPGHSRLLQPIEMIAGNLNATNELHGIKQTERKRLQWWESTQIMLQRPATIWRECIRLVDLDSTLDSASKSRLTEEYGAEATAYENEVARIDEEWRKQLRESALLQEGQAVFAYSHIEYYFREFFDKADEDKGYTLVERKIRKLHAVSLCKATIEETASAFPKADILHWLVGYLTAGPEDLHDYDLALKIAQDGVNEYPKDQMARSNLAWALYRCGRYQECLDMLSPLFDDKNRTNGPVIAMALYQIGKKEEAATWLVRFYSAHIDSYASQYKQKYTDKNIIACPTPRMLSNLDAEAKKMLGPDYEKMAEAYFERNHPGYSSSPLLRANIRLDMKDPQGALADVLEAFASEPDAEDYELLLTRARVYRTLQQNNLALADAKKAHELKPEQERPMVVSMWAHATLGSYEKAIADANALIVISSGASTRYFGRASIHFRFEKFELALIDIEQGLRDNLDDEISSFPRSKAYALRGDCWMKLENPQNAIEAYSAAIERNDRSTEYLEKRGTAYQALGKSDLAEADLAKAKLLNAPVEKTE